MDRMNLWGIILITGIFTGLIIGAAGEPVSPIPCIQPDISGIGELSDPNAVFTVFQVNDPQAALSSNLSIIVQGIEPFYPGSTLNISGHNAATDMTYLFISGHNLPAEGGSLDSPLLPCESDQPASFTSSPVSDTDTWIYNWTIPSDITESGVYSLFAAAGPKNLTDINETEYSSVGIDIETIIGDTVTLNITGNGTYQSGDLIKMSGINTVSDSTYLYVCGQGVPVNGGTLENPTISCISDQPASFTCSQVSDNDSWEYNWTIPSEITWNGTYSLYATAAPKNLTDLQQTRYAEKPVSIQSQEIPDAITLMPGWNFISNPGYLQSGHDTMEIFSDVNSSGHSILWYEGETESWIPRKANDSFSPLWGYWIYSADTISIPLFMNNTTISPIRNLITGWNTLGIQKPDRPVDQALASIHSNWTYLVRYNASMQQYMDPIIHDNTSDTYPVLKNKDGFWIYMKENSTYTG